MLTCKTIKDIDIMKKIWILYILLLSSLQASTNMWMATGQAYGIDPKLLYAISKVESNNRPLVVSVNFTKITPFARERLCQMLQMKHIPFHTLTKVIEIDNENIVQAKQVIAFLDYNHYPSFDIGLMQINNIHKDALLKQRMSLYDLLNENNNLRVAAGILWECYKKYGSSYKAINAYNGQIVGNPYYSKVFEERNKLLLPYENASSVLFYRDI